MSACDAMRAALAAAGAGRAFQHDGLIYADVPGPVVEAYVRGRLDRTPAEPLLRAMLVAFVGEAVWQAHAPAADWTGWRVGRAWAWRLARLEETVRGTTLLAEVAL